MTRIDIITVCGLNSADYAEFFVESLIRTVDDPTRYRLIVGVNDDAAQPQRLERLNERIETKVIDARNDLGYTSMSHGASLDVTFEHVTTEKFIVADVDVAFLSKGWDVMLESLIVDDVVAAGASYRSGYIEKNGFEKYRGFPNIYMSMAVTDVVRECKVSFKPKPVGRNIEDVHGHDAQCYGLPHGSRVFKDTGHELSYNVRSRGYRGIAFDAKTCNDPNAKVLLSGQRGDEYQYNGTPIVSHIGRSTHRNLHTDPIARGWRQCIEAWWTKNNI